MPSPEPFSTRLRKRLPHLSDAEHTWIVYLVDRYNVQPTIRNLQDGKFVFYDNQDRSAVLRVLEWGKDYYYIRDASQTHAEALCEDVEIIVVDGTLAGWLPSKGALRVSEGIWAVSPNSLLPMPQEFDFSRTCAHLAEHGGYTDGSEWICYGCGKGLVFNDHSIRPINQ